MASTWQLSPNMSLNDFSGSDCSLFSGFSTDTESDRAGTGRLLDKYLYQKGGRLIEKALYQLLRPRSGLVQDHDEEKAQVGVIVDYLRHAREIPARGDGHADDFSSLSELEFSSPTGMSHDVNVGVYHTSRFPYEDHEPDLGHVDSDAPDNIIGCSTWFTDESNSPSSRNSQSVTECTECTECSECGCKLDVLRYICSTCGEKTPEPRHDICSAGHRQSKGKAHDMGKLDMLGHLSPRFPTSASASPSSATHIWDATPSPNVASSSPFGLALPPRRPENYGDDGYELCANCVENAGLRHALVGCKGSGVYFETPVPRDSEWAFIQWRRSAPKQKGHFRHAFSEKVWSTMGWEDVEQDDAEECVVCNSSLTSQRYKCASCPKFDLCRACYSQVHEIHPSHAFLAVQHRPPRILNAVDDNDEHHFGMHSGISCAHCLLDIVGARFHCVECENVDICSNCEAAGLPSDLDAPDGGHSLLHVMIKIPIPASSTMMQIASTRVLQLSRGKEIPMSRRPLSALRANGGEAVSIPTTNTTNTLLACNSNDLDHHCTCSGCNQNIVGVRYQCATCPSTSTVHFSLCEGCEPRSYVLHDPMHVFFKLPRPVSRPIVSKCLIPVLYYWPAGPPDGRFNPSKPKGYLEKVDHHSVICDRCMERIHGEWFHCVYCGKDLCDACESIDNHDSTHFFLVFKSELNMRAFRSYADTDNPRGCPPLLNYTVYE